MFNKACNPNSSYDLITNEENKKTAQEDKTDYVGINSTINTNLE